MSSNPFKDAPLPKPEDWDKSAGKRKGLDPDAAASKHFHIRMNEWEHACIQRLAVRRGLTMQHWIRLTLRDLLFKETGE